MSFFSRISRSRMEEEMNEELRSHIQLRADDLERDGLPRAEAERQAAIEFGGRERFREECRDAMGGAFLDTLVRDIRFSLRLLRKSPGFTAIAVLTLALGIGANAVVFGLLNGLILRPLNVPRAGSLWGLQRTKHFGYLSYPNYTDLRDRNRSFDDLAAYEFAMVGMDTGANPTRSWAEMVSGNYFDVLGIHPHLGRLFHASDEHGPESAPYLVLSWTYWHNHFAGDAGAVGRVVRINKHPYTIVGVAPPDFHGTLLFFYPDFFLPLVNQEQVWGGNNMNKRGVASIFQALGHLKAGVSPERAAADLNSIGADLQRNYPKEVDDMTFVLARPGLYGDFLGRPVRAFVAGLMLLAGLILLAACANLGSLFAARAADRSREVALRLALGAARSRIARQLLTEAALISLLGGAAGLWISVALLRALSAWQPLPRFPIHIPVTPDGNVYAAALVLALLSGALFAIVPMRQTMATDPYQIIKGGQTAGNGRRVTLRDLLVVLQVAVCAVLITATMVAVRGLTRSLHASFGFQPQSALLVDTELTIAGYREDRVPEMQKRMIDAIEAIPGVKAVGSVERPPLSEGWIYADVFTDQTTDLRPVNATALAITYYISPRYFDAAGTSLLAGRPFTWHDDKNAPRVAVVNREFARRVFGSTDNVLGRWYKLHNGDRVQVVGMVEDGKYTTNLAERPQLAMFLPVLQTPHPETWLVVRSTRDPLELAPAIIGTLHGLDPELPFYVQPWNKELDAAMFAPRVATLSLGALGGIGALLAVTGVFGMAAYSVSKRLREMGIRVALGAQRREVLQAALGRAVKLLALGSVAGLVLGVLAARVLASIVYQATPRDPLVLTGVVVAMMVLGLLATWIPARRALSVDPWRLLREQ